MRKAYQSDISDAEWSCLAGHLPAPRATGRPRIYPLREIINANFYVVRSGCSWRLLPHDFLRDGLPFSCTLGNGVSTAPGRESIGRSANALDA
jgi:transposase